MTSLRNIALIQKTIQNIDLSILVWFLLYGEPEGIRTPDPRLRRPVLYPTELLTHKLNDNKYINTFFIECQEKLWKNFQK